MTYHYYTMFSEKVNKKGARAFTLAPKMHSFFLFCDTDRPPKADTAA